MPLVRCVISGEPPGRVSVPPGQHVEGGVELRNLLAFPPQWFPVCGEGRHCQSPAGRSYLGLRIHKVQEDFQKEVRL